MNTFFRQKLTNKTIDLLEKVEDRKTREEEEDCLILESPTILAIISLPALIILGIIVPIIAIREGDYIWGIIGMIIFGGMCSWLTGYSLFWKVVIDHEKVEYHCNLLEYLTQRDIQTKNSGVNVRYRGKHRFFKGFNEFIKEKTRRCDNDFEKIERHVFFLMELSTILWIIKRTTAWKHWFLAICERLSFSKYLIDWL